MENNKLKKLGKYFTKGLQAGVLATALIAGNASCSQPSGDSGYEIDDNQGQQGGNQQNQGQQPAYYIDEALGGQRFAEEGAIWQSNKGPQQFSSHYADAKKFIAGKVTELSAMIKGQTSNDLYRAINQALVQYNNNLAIDKNITNNYNALAPIFARFEKTTTIDTDDTKLFQYRTSYQVLAAKAYNESLGHAKNKSWVPTNSEIKISGANDFFNEELVYANLSYEELTANNNQRAKSIMNSTLAEIANETGTNSAVLKKVVELALYNESLYGLHDLGLGDVGDFTTSLEQRTLTNFYMKIIDTKTSTQSIDDRTM